MKSIDEFKKEVNDLYNQYKLELKTNNEKCQQLFDAIDYSFNAGGKRIRPYIILLSYEFFDGKPDNKELLFPFMCAIEMIHTFSLIHDDMPEIDNDEFRRGKESTWKKFGVDTALLSGDALIFRAYQLLDNFQFQVAKKVYNYKNEIDIDLNYKIAYAKKLFTSLCGIDGMILGEAMDTLNFNCFNLEDLQFMYDCKTSALIKVAFQIGAIFANANEEEINYIGDVGILVGRAFQIQDDILDVTSTKEKLGKPIGSDEKNNKTTYVSLVGIDKAKMEVHNLFTKAENIIDNLNKNNAEYVKEFLYMLKNREM